MIRKARDLMAVLSASFGLSAFASPTPPKCNLLPPPENVVTVPAYAEGQPCDESPLSEEKVQYEAVNDESPIFKEQVSGEEYTSGAFYRSGPELYISPGPDFVSTRELISEPTEGELSSVAPHP